MGKSLELVRRGTSALPDVRRDRKTLISKKLKKKENLTRREHYWVYNSVYEIGLGATAVVASGFLAAVGGGVIDVAAMLGIGLGTSTALAGLITTGYRVSREAAKDDSSMDFRQRRRNAFYEHCRVHATHSSDRRSRIAELDGKYNQYSVWVQGGRDRKVVFYVLEHVPWNPEIRFSFQRQLYAGRVMEKGAQPLEKIVSREQIENKLKGITKTRDYFEDEQDDEPKKVNEVSTEEINDNFWETLVQTQADMEHMAREAERLAYEKALDQMEVKRMSLQLRRG